MKSKKRYWMLIPAIVLIGLVLWIVWANDTPVLTQYTVSEDALPQDFDGYRIAQISDLHNASLGRNNKKILTLLKRAEPDIIAITGDLVDSRKTNTKRALAFVEEAVKIAPCYYVSGNHEARIAQYSTLLQSLDQLGVTVLEDGSAQLLSGDSEIQITGVRDPSFDTDYLSGDSYGVMREKLPALVHSDSYTILLSHRPELFAVYAENDVELVLSGHAHGGQFRLPFVGGVFAPNQVFFPKYDEGVYSEGRTDMVVSCGLGNSLFPFRINNRPEVILVELTVK